MSLRFRARFSDVSYHPEPSRSPANLVSSLERGEVGLDGRELPHVAFRRAWRRAWKIVAFVSVAFFLTCGWFALGNGARLAREQTRDAVSRALDADVARGPCVRVESSRGPNGGGSGAVGRVVAFRDGETMVAPRIVSRSTETVRTVETLDDPACAGKRIRRRRRAALSVTFVSLDDWPWGRRNTVSVVTDAAVCVQHYVDVMDGKLGCDAKDDDDDVP